MKGIESSNMTKQELDWGTSWSVFLDKLSFKSTQEFFVLRSADWSKESSGFAEPNFEVGLLHFGSNPRVRRQMCHPSTQVVSFFKKNLTQNCTSFLNQRWLFHSTCSSWFPKEYWWIVPVPEGNQSWMFVLFTAVSLFESNWFATGNKCFLGQIFRTAQGKTTIQIQSCWNSDDGSWWLSETKV